MKEQRKHPATQQAFAWDVCYRNRTLRLQKLIALNAPEVIIERECRSVLKAIARSHRSPIVILRWVRDSFREWRSLKWFVIQWNWYRQVRGWDEKRCETHFFGEDPEDDPATKELQRLYDLENRP